MDDQRQVQRLDCPQTLVAYVRRWPTISVLSPAYIVML